MKKIFFLLSILSTTALYVTAQNTFPATGNVGIGIATPGTTLDIRGVVRIGEVKLPGGYKLYVEEGILAEKVKVAVKNGSDWADHVFNYDYKLLPIPLLEQYIRDNKHLPGIPSATQMVQEGNNLGQTDARLLEKIEELTLYTIQLYRQNETYAKQIADLTQRLQALEQKNNQ